MPIAEAVRLIGPVNCRNGSVVKRTLVDSTAATVVLLAFNEG